MSFLLRRYGPSPYKEQEICLLCGFCCDGTIFHYATLIPGEKGNLPEKIEKNIFTKDGTDYFHLPCRYFKGKCSIYKKKKAYVCSAYKCELLNSFREKKMPLKECLKIVKQGRKMRKEVVYYFQKYTGKKEKTSFRKILPEIGNILKSVTGNGQSDVELEMLIARSNIFESLLIKYFRSHANFDKMTIPLTDNSKDLK
ncbi:MAG: hypothetical protein WBK43_07640 [Prolixibacteraceae bacterium]|jgi:hypothetical protein|nr:hypothetical protein [Bacteroidota bacterium]